MMIRIKAKTPVQKLVLKLRESEIKQYENVVRSLLFFAIAIALMALVAFWFIPEKVIDKIFYIILYIVSAFVFPGITFLYSNGLAKTRVHLDQSGLHVVSGLPVWIQNLFGATGQMPLQSWSANWSEITLLQLKTSPQARMNPGGRCVVLGIHVGLRYRELRPYQWGTPEYEAKYPANSAQGLNLFGIYWRQKPENDTSAEVLLSPVMKFITQQGLKVKIDEKAFVDTGVRQRRTTLALLFLLFLAMPLLLLTTLNKLDNDTPSTQPTNEAATALHDYPDLPRNEATTLNDSNDNIIAASFSSDGQYFAAGGKEVVVFVWKYPEIELLHRLEGHRDKVQSLAFSPDNQTLASGSEDNTVRLWRVETGALQKVLNAPSPPGGYQRILSVAFSPDGQYLAAANWDNNIYLWRMPGGDLWRTLQGSQRPWWDVWKRTNTGDGHQNSVNAVAFSPDGKWLASGAFDNTVKLWEMKTGNVHKTLHWHSDWVLDVAFSPDGRVLASSGQDHQVRLWDVLTGERLRSLQGHTNDVASVAFHPDSRVLVSAGNDRLIKYWEVETGALLHTLPKQVDYVNVAIFSPDGKQLLTGSGTGLEAKVLGSAKTDTVKLWK